MKAELGRIYGALDEMHHEVRLALVLHRVEGMSLPEAAETMGISLSTIKPAERSAERLLQAALKGGRQESPQKSRRTCFQELGNGCIDAQWSRIAEQLPGPRVKGRVRARWWRPSAWSARWPSSGISGPW